MKKILVLAFLLLLILIAYWADTGNLPAALAAVYAFPNGDRVGHFVLYGTLAYLLTAAFPFRHLRAGRWSVPLGVIAALALAALEEFTQLFIPARSADWIDLAAGWLGVYASTWIPCMRGACPPSE